MRSSLSPATVELRDGLPRLVNWSGQTFYVQRILRTWVRPDARWWRRTQRRFFLVETNDGTMELCEGSPDWFITGLIREEETEALELVARPGTWHANAPVPSAF